MVREATEQCELMAILKRAIKDGRFEADDRLKPFRATEIKNSLSVSDGLVCRGKRVVIPPNLQKLVVQISHDGHQGVSKAKSFLRTFCWFPGINLVEKQVKRCLPCQSVRPANHHEPVQPSRLPDGPWGPFKKYVTAKKTIFDPPSPPCHHLSPFALTPLPPLSPPK